MPKFDVKVDKRSVSQVKASISADLEKFLGNTTMKDEIGRTTVERIKYQARITEPLNFKGSFPPLKPSTVKTRRYLERYNQTHPTYEATRANVTITGAFLDSLKYIVNSTSTVVIKFVGDHPRYKSRNGVFGKVISNDLLNKFLMKKGFFTFDQTLDGNPIITKRIRSIVVSYLRRALRGRN